MRPNVYIRNFVYKINSSRLNFSNWDLRLNIPTSIKNKEFVSLAESDILRFIKEYRGVDQDTVNKKEVQIKQQIKKLKKHKNSVANRKLIKEKYAELYELMFIDDYVMIVMDNNSDFDYINKYGFKINGNRFKRLFATSGGVKNNTVVYVKEAIYNFLNDKIDNGRNHDVKMVPAKFEAYRGLTASSSSRVSYPPQNGKRRILVVKDLETKFKSDIIRIDDLAEQNTNKSNKDVKILQEPLIEYLKDYDVEFNASDGFGMISPNQSTQWANELVSLHEPLPGYCIRNSFCKGMLFTYDFKQQLKEMADAEENVVDVWGNIYSKQDIMDVEIILTASMLKLWNSYSSIEDYLDNCIKNGYQFSVTKIISSDLEDIKYLNYQFIQSIEMTDEDIENLVRPTIQEIREVMSEDYRKSLIFLGGKRISEKDFVYGNNNIAKALMAEKETVNDPFIRSTIHKMIKKKIDEAKIGTLKVNGNFSVISGDPYALCQFIFSGYNMDKVTGLLKSGEFYSNYWNNKGKKEVVAFRAPMSCHNNIRKLRLVDNEHVNKWYKYMSTVTVFNAWDTTTHALNGADMDGDTVMTTDNEVILKNVREEEAIICVQKTAKKMKIDEKKLSNSNKNGFGDKIGSVTNKVTEMYDVLSRFDKNSEEYKVIDYRIKCGQLYQQAEVDKIKGIISSPMPSWWHKFDENQTEFNNRIIANKRPYFFIYIYEGLKKEFETFHKNAEDNCMIKFEMNVNELRSQNNPTVEMIDFLKWYDVYCPVSIDSSTVNRICWKIEKEFKEFNLENKKIVFDYSLFKTKKQYKLSDYEKIKEIHSRYVKELQAHKRDSHGKSKRARLDNKIKKDMLIEDFKKQILDITSNGEEMANIVLDICYSKGNTISKQFAWDIAGEEIINNLLQNNGGYIEFPEKNSEGNFEYDGETFNMKRVNILEMEEDII